MPVGDGKGLCPLPFSRAGRGLRCFNQRRDSFSSVCWSSPRRSAQQRSETRSVRRRRHLPRPRRRPEPNHSRVIRARLRGSRESTAGSVWGRAPFPAANARKRESWTSAASLARGAGSNAAAVAMGQEPRGVRGATERDAADSRASGGAAAEDGLRARRPSLAPSAREVEPSTARAARETVHSLYRARPATGRGG